MLTIFSIPKPFEGETERRQCRAIASWLALTARVILLGDEAGVSQTATRLDLEHVATLALNEHGTPFLDSAFMQLDQRVSSGIRCFVNADVVLTNDVLSAIEALHAVPTYLLVGQTRDLELTDSDLADPAGLRRRALKQGHLRGAAAIDWFVFPSHQFQQLPPFLVGRAAFDNWMIWKARQSGPVIDATDAVVAVHQPHDYSHLAGGKDEAYYGEEAKENLRLAGGKGRMYTLHDASHKMRADFSIHRNIGAVLRMRENVRKVGWKLGIR